MVIWAVHWAIPVAVPHSFASTTATFKSQLSLTTSLERPSRIYDTAEVFERSLPYQCPGQACDHMSSINDELGVSPTRRLFNEKFDGRTAIHWELVIHQATPKSLNMIWVMIHISICEGVQVVQGTVAFGR